MTLKAITAMAALSLFELSPASYIPVVRLEGKALAECTCAHMGSIHTKFLGMALVLKGWSLLQQNWADCRVHWQ